MHCNYCKFKTQRVEASPGQAQEWGILIIALLQVPFPPLSILPFVILLLFYLCFLFQEI